MPCPAAKSNRKKWGCSGVCCECIYSHRHDGETPRCLALSHRLKARALRVLRLRSKPLRDAQLAHERYLACPLHDEKRHECPCKKRKCPYISNCICCLCIVRYLAKGSIPKCLKYNEVGGDV